MIHLFKNWNISYLFTCCILLNFAPTNALSSLARNDPYPVYTTLDPQYYLYRGARLLRREDGWDGPWHESLSFSISPFGQQATIGRNNQKAVAELGDLQGNPTGRTNMIALLLGVTPNGQTLPPTLVQAQQQIFPGTPTPIECSEIAEDPNFLFGFYSFPIRYKKRGVRFDFNTRIFCDFCLNIQAGVADICQTVTFFNDLTCQAACSCNFLCDLTTDQCNAKKCTVEKSLMKQLKNIAQELNLDLGNFHAVSIEEIRFNFFWCKPFEFNITNEFWPDFQLFPFAELSGSISPGKVTHPNKQFATVFGNNGHSAVGGKAGMAFNFIETIEISGEIGFTHFFERSVCNLRIPNNICQSGIFPFATAAKYQPGHNWHFAGKLAANHFLNRLSFWFEYIMVDHGPDHIRLCTPDPAFFPEALENITTFKYKVANVGFNYDISPTVSLGFLWQAPLSQQNTYRTTTLMIGFNVIL